MTKNYVLPNHNIVFVPQKDAADYKKDEQDFVVNTLFAMGIIPKNQVKGFLFDREYPYLFWDADFKRLDRSREPEVDESYNSDEVQVKSAIEFLKYFVEVIKPTKQEIKISKDYTAVVYKSKIIVGCQIISKQALEKVYKAMQELNER
jgi:hypothetical protein